MKLKVIVTVLLFALSQSGFAQTLPSKIRGYKVYTANVSVRNTGELGARNADREALLKIGKPEIAEVGFAGITFEIGADIGANIQSGRIDFLTFNDFRINGLSVVIEEYKHEFSLKKGETVSMPKPVRVTIGTVNMARAARRELIESKKEWLVTGTVFIFGRFKKFGFSFKRVIPVKIDLKLDNPLTASGKSGR